MTKETLNKSIAAHLPETGSVTKMQISDAQTFVVHPIFHTIYFNVIAVFTFFR